MRIKQDVNISFILPVIAIQMIFVAACTTGINDLEGTIEVQNTQIAVLNTQVAELDETNWSQWESISYLATQMPFALGLITPIPEGVTITPTPYIDIEYPPDTRTGIPEIDDVIDAILGSDIGSRIELVRFIQLLCTTADGLGGPPKCEGGETDGEIVTVFPVLYSEGIHVRQEHIREVYDFSVRGLLTVYIVPESAYKTDDWPVGDYAIVFTSEDGGHAHTVSLHVTDGEIIRLEFQPQWPPFDWIWDRSNNFILPPSTRPNPNP